MKSIIMGLVMLTALSVADPIWTYEQVDTAGTWVSPKIAVWNSGEVFIAYSDTASRTSMMAYKDTAWHWERIPYLGSYMLAAGPHQKLGIASLGSRLTYFERTDSGWVEHSDSSPGWGHGNGFAFDTSGAPTVSYLTYQGPPDVSCLWDAARLSGTWTRWGMAGMGGTYDGFTGITALTFDSRNSGHALVSERHHFGSAATRFDGFRSTWRDTVLAGGAMGATAQPFSIAASRHDSIYACYNGRDDTHRGFFCGQERVDTFVDWAIVRAGPDDCPQIVYQCDWLRYAYRSNPRFRPN
jgi:hypothetical protein